MRFDAAGCNPSPAVNNKFVAPANGELIKVFVRATSAPGTTRVSFHKASDGTTNLNTTGEEIISVNMSAADTTYTANFTNSSFNAGDILGLSLNPFNTPNDVNVTFVWLFDWTT